MSTASNTDERTRPVFAYTQVVGLVLMALGPFLSLVIELAFSGSEAFGLFALIGPPVVLSLAGAALAWRFGTWANVVGIVLGIALLGLFGPFLIGALTTINSVFDFVPALVAIVGALTAVIAGVAAIVRRSVLVVGPTGTERRIATVGASVLGVLAILSAAATVFGVTEVAEAEREGATEVTLAEFEFRPDPIEVTGGEQSRLVLHNSDHVLHTFTVDELDLDVTITPGSDGLVTIDDDAEPGTYRVYCRPHSEPGEEDPDDAGMVATLEVSG